MQSKSFQSIQLSIHGLRTHCTLGRCGMGRCRPRPHECWSLPIQAVIWHSNSKETHVLEEQSKPSPTQSPLSHH